MVLIEVLKGAKEVASLSPKVKVEQTVVGELIALFPQLERKEIGEIGSGRRSSLRVGVVNSLSMMNQYAVGKPSSTNWMFVRFNAETGIDLLASQPNLLYLVFTLATDDYANLGIEEFSMGRFIYPAFCSQRPLYDLFVTQHARTVENFDRTEYFRGLARCGYSHAEINGLAFPEAIESGPKDEVYPRFYTYCPALDQFVSSELNRGFYPEEYLRANLEYLKSNASIAESFGLEPGIVCFEPRSVPDALLEKYPMLRGARVDHPLRSFKPRYNLSVAHPVVRAHYSEMVENLMNEVPSLSYMSIWSNDSGAGFEYTNSLYVGRNGGGYLVREWLGSGEIEAAAARNIVNFMKLIRDAGRKTNPVFRVLLRMEPFWSEHEHILDQLDEGLDLEVSSLKGKGWELSYKHPRFDEDVQIHTSALHNKFDESEKIALGRLSDKRVNADIVFAPGIIWNHEPLIGIPFPYLVSEKLSGMKRAGVSNVCVLGGGIPESFAPFDINQEVVRAFGVQEDFKIDAFLQRKSVEWAGESAPTALEIWKLADDAVRAFPIPVWIYAAWGVWYRLAVRPLVPNIDCIPEEDRAYYEKYLLATPHNRCRIDMRYDVGFDLLDPERALRAVDFIDRNCIPPLNDAIKCAEVASRKSIDEVGRRFAVDQLERLRALKCWMRTQRNVAAWVGGVHKYLGSEDGGVRSRCHHILREMVLDEIDNTRELLDLWENSASNWMIVSSENETTFVYSRNFGELLKKKIALMTGRQDDEPYVDPDFQWRLSSFRF